MVHLPIAATVAISPRLIDVVRTTNTFSPAERLFLAKTLLDSLVSDDLKTEEATLTESANPSLTLAEVVAQIKATPSNPNQIQRATKTLDEVFAAWEESPDEEAQLTTEEWEQHWWAIRQAMKERDQQPKPLTSWIADDHG